MISSILQGTKLSLRELGRHHLVSYRLSQEFELGLSFCCTRDSALPCSVSLGHLPPQPWPALMVQGGQPPHVVTSFFPLRISAKIFTCVCHRTMPFEAQLLLISVGPSAWRFSNIFSSGRAALISSEKGGCSHPGRTCWDRRPCRLVGQQCPRM